MSRILHKRLQKEIALYKQENFKFPNLILRYQESNLLRWHFIIYDLQDTCFQNGVYYGYIHLPNEYPFKAPDFYFVTPNGKFETNTKICTTFTSFHPETYTCTWNILSMTEGMVSYMTDDTSSGVGIINTTSEEKKNFANRSLEWNIQNQQFLSVFPDYKELFNV
jgi:ubiquitin-conjugating enzyme E2 J2